MRGQFWFCFLKWELNFGFVFWDKRLILVFWDERSILLVAIWSDSPRRGCQVSAKESHLRESLQISLSPSGSDPSLNDASLMTRPAPHFLEVTFLPHFPRKSADGEEPTNCDVCESQWCGFMAAALFGLCSLLGDDYDDANCISQILKVHFWDGVFLRSCKLYIFLK